jgi:asparagine synthetase B (glutamine-hydrolysing)
LFCAQVSEEENDTAVLLALLSGCNTTTEIVELLETVEGPYAFVYWQVRLSRGMLIVVMPSEACVTVKASNKRLFFGKDKLGRRSLLLHRPSSSSEPLILSSVAALPQEIYEPTTSAKPDKEKRCTPHTAAPGNWD